MNKQLLFLLFFSLAAYGQQQKRIAIVNTEDDGEPQLKIQELFHLTDKLREIANRVLPPKSYAVMTQQSIVDNLGSLENMQKKCSEAQGCLAKLGREINADYIGQARIGRFGDELTIKVELYGSGNGTLINSFTGNAKDIYGLSKVIDDKAPAMFEKMIIKTPEQLCDEKSNEEKDKGWSLVNGECKTTAQRGEDYCKSQGFEWIDGVCKTPEQAKCEIVVGNKWVGGVCKSNEQIDCEAKDGWWDSGLCKSKQEQAQSLQPPPPPPPEVTMLDLTNFGVKLGVNFPDMSYSDNSLDGYSSSVYANVLFELFCQYDITPLFSVRPGIKFITRGQFIEEPELAYRIDAKYTEITLPFIYTFKTVGISDIAFNPYLFAAPVFGIARGGYVNYKENNIHYKTEINQGNLSTFAFGLYLGVGLKYPMSIKDYSVVPGFEIGYHLGLTDTYSEKEIDETANALNAYYYDIKGTRKNRGIEFGLTFAFPLSTFKKLKPEPKPEPPPLPPPPEPIYELVSQKECHTIEEMREFILEGQNIQGKKICAIKQVNFKLNSAELLPDGKVYLDQIVVLMATNVFMHVKVIGHSDNIGNADANMKLSRDRAKATLDYLVSKGITASRLSFEFFGSTRPIADNNTEDGRAINRRVEFEITNQ